MKFLGSKRDVDSVWENIFNFFFLLFFLLLFFFFWILILNFFFFFFFLKKGMCLGIEKRGNESGVLLVLKEMLIR